MFSFVTIADLASLAKRNMYRLATSFDLIVGIPRSGMIPAYLLGLYRNTAVTDVESFLRNQPPAHGDTRSPVMPFSLPLEARSVLLVDDSLDTGESLNKAVKRIQQSSFRGTLKTCVPIIAPGTESKVDIFFEVLPQPRLFEWNCLHTRTEAACFDIDGVLCCDPTEEQNDDGLSYSEFLCNTPPLFRPTGFIGHIVSSRLERYRGPTEAWLSRHEIRYGRLHLLNLPSKAERQRLNAHARHKADVYKRTDTKLFFESDPSQSAEIARLSGKPVICVPDMQLHLPGQTNLQALPQNLRWRLKGPARDALSWLYKHAPTFVPDAIHSRYLAREVRRVPK